MSYRIEADSIGEVKVLKNNLWGAQTQRSLENFKIGNEKFSREFIQAYAIIKFVAADVNCSSKLISKEIKSAIQKSAMEIYSGKWDNQFPLVVWQTGSGTQTNMNFNEVISNLSNINLGFEAGKKQPVHPNDHVNCSQSTNDTFPTAINIASAYQVNNNLLPSIEKLRKELNNKSIEFRKIIKVGRTHLQDATPLTLGQEFSGYVSQLDNGIRSIKNSLQHVYELAIGGTAVGTGLNAPKDFSNMCTQLIAEKMKLPFTSAKNKFESLASQDSIVQLSGSLKTLAVSLNKIANDIRWLASGPRSGIGEIILPSNEPGSSIMPGKINPTQCEAMLMVVAQVIGNDTTLSFSGASGNFELNVYRPVIAYNILQSIRLLSDVCNSFSDNCVQGIEPNLEKINNNLNNSLMLVTALTPYIGYDKAASAAKKAYKDNITLKESIIQLGYLNDVEYDKYVNPKNMI